MRKGILRLGVLAVAFVSLSAFDWELPMPPEYSPGYSYVDVIGPDGRVKRALVPDACMAEPEEAAAASIGEDKMLQPGCANAYNLQRMVARKKDLVRGRHMGRAPMAPAARAAKKYIEGTDTAQKGSQNNAVDTTTASTGQQ